MFFYPNVRFIVDITRLYEAFIELLFHFEKEGVKHSACMPSCTCAWFIFDLYGAPEMQIAEDDDETFGVTGAMKVACDMSMRPFATECQRGCSFESHD